MKTNRVLITICALIAVIKVCESVESVPQSRHLSSKQTKGKNELLGVPYIESEKTLAITSKRPDSGCVNPNRLETRGTISSPNYPNNYNNSTSCMWYITGLHSKDIITISFDDLDIEVANDFEKLCPQKSNKDDTNEDTEQCCIYNWIKIGSDSDNEIRYCGHSEDNNLILKPFISTSNRVWIKFHTSNEVKGGRGFHLSYIISSFKSTKCKSDEFQCANGKCILSNWRCNSRNECEDGSDELMCDDICLGANQVKCSPVSHSRVMGCYLFPTQRCDSVWNCENGVDERGCGGCPSDMYMCRSRESCYSEAKRCDGIVDCADFTDELNCGFCGPNKIQCGPNSLTQCYEPSTQRCNRVLDCPNGIDEIDCIHGCYNKILCSSGSGCYLPEERCNGVPDCNDYSDEKNCSLDLCRAERGSFLCGNGRCIRAIWTCDRSNDCADGTDEMNCLKNSVITAAIMGSLICGLLLVIAISCTCKLIALRQVERHESSSHTSPSHISQHYGRQISINGLNSESETQLFRLEHGFFFREPPPSYAAAVGGYPSECNNSYIEQIRQIRRQRRLRRNRRRPPTPPPLEFVDTANTDNSNNSSPTTSAVTNISDNHNESSNKNDKEEVSCSATNSTSITNNVHIELESIPSLSQSDCDSQPLIS